MKDLKRLSDSELLEHIKTGKEILKHDGLDIIDYMDMETQIASYEIEAHDRRLMLNDGLPNNYTPIGKRRTSYDRRG